MRTNSGIRDTHLLRISVPHEERFEAIKVQINPQHRFLHVSFYVRPNRPQTLVENLAVLKVKETWVVEHLQAGDIVTSDRPLTMGCPSASASVRSGGVSFRSTDANEALH